MLKDKTVVIGVSGGIAVYKTLDVVSRLRKLGVNVNVIMTKSATEFVTPLSFQSLSQNYVVCDMFEDPKTWDVEHISLAKRADVFLIAPATANVIGKIANGIADDMLTTTVMATKAKVLIAPAMNTNMYENPILQRNINTLKELGYNFVEPESGRLACGDTGKGKLASPETIVDEVVKLLSKGQDLKGKSIIVTAGPTVESIDPMRYITNRSTGKMGYSIAKEAIERGADVTLITGPTNLTPPQNLKNPTASAHRSQASGAAGHTSFPRFSGCPYPGHRDNRTHRAFRCRASYRPEPARGSAPRQGPAPSPRSKPDCSPVCRD